MKHRIGVIIASTRQGRLGEKVARWFVGLAEQHPQIEPVLLDLRDFPIPFYDEPRGTRAAESAWPNEAARRWVAAISPLDGFVIVTPEYNHSFPASLKNALDHAYAGWNAKPLGFVSYGGGAGGARAVEQLRLVAVELQMAPVRDEVNIAFAGRSLDAQGAPTDPFHAMRAQALLGQMAWWAQALAEARAKSPPPGGAPPKPR
jgi:NAD(P)H-dependent FMN reductase